MSKKPRPHANQEKRSPPQARGPLAAPPLQPAAQPQTAPAEYTERSFDELDLSTLELPTVEQGELVSVAIDGDQASAASLIASAFEILSDEAAAESAAAQQSDELSPTVLCAHNRVRVDRDAGSARCEDCQADISGICTLLLQPLEPGRDESVKPHLRCPGCWTGQGGRAAKRKWHTQKSGTLQKRCYICNQCGGEWVVEVRSDIKDDLLTTTTDVVEFRKPVD